MNKTIIAFVGENENGILRHLSIGLMGLLRPLGYDGHVVDLHDPSWPDRLNALLRLGVVMAWGHAGVGARLETTTSRCVWDEAKVPFISVLADPPCWRPSNHAIDSHYVANAYLYPEWLRVQRQFIKSRQLSAVVQGGIVPNPWRDRIPWAKRPRRMVLVKTCGNPHERRAGWQNFPRRMRALLEDAAMTAVARRTGDVTDIVLAATEAHGLVLDGRTDLLFALMTEVDRYVREVRATNLGIALLDLPVEIHGRGWDHIKQDARKARFLPAFDADMLPRLYGETQIMLNTSPNFSSGVHERIAHGFDARCCVVSDENDYTRQYMAEIPTFFGIDPNDPALADRLHAIHADDTDYTAAAAPALDLVAREFDGLRYMQSLLELAQEIQMSEQFSGYRH